MMTQLHPTNRPEGHTATPHNPDVDCLLSAQRRVLAPRRVRRRLGFTLIEILVAISIIALLAGLVTVGALKAGDAAQRNRAQSLMRALIGAQDEFKAQSGLGINLNHDGNSPINWPAGTFSENVGNASGTAGSGGLSSSERFVVGCFLFDESEEALRAAAQGSGILVDGDGDNFLELRDPWDNQLIYRLDNDPNNANYDNRFPTYRDPFFISAGKDGDFGTDDDITTLELGT